MAKADGVIRINTHINTDGIKQGENAMRSSFGRIAKMAAATFSIMAMVKFGKEAIDLASDIAEVDNVVQKSFGDMRGEMDAFANSAIKNLGMSRLTAYQTGSTFMSMGRSMLDSAEDAKDMALALTSLTGNMASFYNVEQDVASTALKSIYTGETETMKRYGVVMSEVNLQEYAYSQGLQKKIKDMTQSEKVMLRYGYVMKQLDFIGNDFADTSDGWANQTRILSEQWKEFMTIVGDGLITALTPAIRMLNNVVSVLINIGNAIKGVLATFGIQMQSSTEQIGSGAKDAAAGMEDYADATEKAGKVAKGALGAFDDLNVLQQSSGSGSGASGGASGGSIEQYAPTQAEMPEVKFPWLDNLIEKLGPVIDAIDRFKKSLDPLKKFVAKGLNDFYQDFLVPVGNWWLGEGIPRFIDALTEMNNNIDWDKLNNALDTLWKALAPFAINVGEGLLWLWENVLVPLATWTISDFLPVFLETLAGAIDVLNAAIDLAKPVLEWLWDNFLQPLASWTGGVIVSTMESFRDALRDIADILNNLPNTIKKNKTLVELLAIAIGTLTAAILAHNIAHAIKLAGGIAEIAELGILWVQITALTVAETVATAVTSAFAAAVAFLTSPITLIILAIGALIAVCVLLYQNWDVVKAKAQEIWSAITKILSDFMAKIKKGITDTATNIKDKWVQIWTSLKDTVSKIFEDLWANIKKVINAILAGVESMANGVVSGINTVINAINAVSFDIPDWVPIWGGKSWHMHIKTLDAVKLPRLANGGITTGSTLANIGEAGREAILPLENNMGYLEKFASQIADKINTNGNAPVYLQMDGKTFARLYNPYGKAEQNRIGLSFT